MQPSHPPLTVRERMLDEAVRRVYPLKIMREISEKAEIQGTSKAVLNGRYWEACAEFRILADALNEGRLVVGKPPMPRWSTYPHKLHHLP